MSLKLDPKHDGAHGLFAPLGKDIEGALRRRRGGADDGDAQGAASEQAGAIMAMALGHAKGQESAGASHKGAAAAADIMSHYSEEPERSKPGRPYMIPKPAPETSTSKRKSVFASDLDDDRGGAAKHDNARAGNDDKSQGFA